MVSASDEPNESLFDQIVAPMKDEFVTPDDVVEIQFIGGTGLELHQVSAGSVATSLARRGYCAFETPDGSTCYLFAHAVACVIGRKSQ